MERHGSQMTTVREGRWVKSRWTMVGALALGTVVAVTSAQTVASTTRADSSPLDTVLQSTPGLSQIQAQHLGTPLKLSQTVHGFTPTIEEVYADANKVVVVIHTSGPAGRKFSQGLYPSSSPTISDAATGNALRYVVGADDMNGTSASVYDASAATVTGSLLHLTYRFPGVSGFEPVDASIPAVTAPGESYSSVGTVRPDIGIATRRVTVNAPFTFNLDVPVTPQVRNAVIGQTQSLGGMQATVDRVVVTPTSARVYVQIASNDPQNMPGATLTIGGHAYFPLTSRIEDGGRRIYDFDEDLYGRTGAWNFTLRADSLTKASASYDILMP